jgi:hypothetical protein
MLEHPQLLLIELVGELALREMLSAGVVAVHQTVEIVLLRLYHFETGGIVKVVESIVGVGSIVEVGDNRLLGVPSAPPARVDLYAADLVNIHDVDVFEFLPVEELFVLQQLHHALLGLRLLLLADPQLLGRLPVYQSVQEGIVLRYDRRRFDGLSESTQLLFDCYPLPLPELPFVYSLLYSSVGHNRDFFIVSGVIN